MTKGKGYSPEQRKAFQQRFSELVAELGVTNEALSNLLFNEPIHDRALHNYQLGANMPLKRVIFTIAHRFNVSVAYLLGKTGIRGEPEDEVKRLIAEYGPQVPAKWNKGLGPAYVDNRIRIHVNPVRRVPEPEPEPESEPEPLEPLPVVVTANGREVITLTYLGDGRARLTIEGIFPFDTAIAVVSALHPA